MEFLLNTQIIADGPNESVPFQLCKQELEFGLLYQAIPCNLSIRPQENYKPLGSETASENLVRLLDNR